MEMVRSAICNFFYVNVIVYNSGSVVSDHIHIKKLHLIAKSPILPSLESLITNFAILFYNFMDLSA